jgi:hypothetical protein
MCKRQARNIEKKARMRSEMRLAKSVSKQRRWGMSTEVRVDDDG